jgi:DNA-binding beta-propeller fold protein YncE
VGGLSAGSCRDVAGVPTCTLYATGRTLRSGDQFLFAFDFQQGMLIAGPLFERNVFSQERGADSRGVAIGTDGSTLYFASRFPDALAVVDVGRVPVLPSDGCVLPPGQTLPPGAPCPVPPVSSGQPRFATLDLIAAPKGINAVVAIPRTLPTGGSSDLIVFTDERSLGFVDTRTGTLAGQLFDVGTAPSEIAFRLVGTGARLYVPSFGRGTLAVVDIPDLFHPEAARVVALLGKTQQEGF